MQSTGDLRRGKTHGDTQEFDYVSIMSEYPPEKCKIWKIHVYHDKKNIFGVRVDYFVFEQNLIVEGGLHMGSFWTGGIEEIVQFAEDEYLSQITGKNGNILDNLGFVTSKGRKFSFGGAGGNPFEIIPPSDYHIGYLKGGLGGHLHFIEAVPVQYGTGKIFAANPLMLKQQHNLSDFVPTEQFKTSKTTYSVGKEVGRGCFGAIYLGKSSQGTAVAIKKLPKGTRKEYDICRLFDHPNVIKVLDYHETNSQSYVVFEFCERKDLKALTQKKSSNRLDELEALEIFAQILEGMKEIHKKNWIHKDIKPKNILLTENKTVKICDFGISTEGNVSELAGYDVFCWGMSLYKTVVGKWPFDPPNSLQQTMMDLARQNRPLNFPPHLSLGCQSIIRATLEGERSKRIDTTTLTKQINALITEIKRYRESINEKKDIIQESKDMVEEKKEITDKKPENPEFLSEKKEIPSPSKKNEEVEIRSPGKKEKAEEKQEKAEEKKMDIENNLLEKSNSQPQKTETPEFLSEKELKKSYSTPQQVKAEEVVPSDNGIMSKSTGQKEVKSYSETEGRPKESVKGYVRKEMEFKVSDDSKVTQWFSDEPPLSNFSKHHYKLWQLMICHDDSTIYGFRSDYFIFEANLILQGQKFVGTQYKGGEESIIQFAVDEYIVRVFGKFDTALRNFGIETNYGRVFFYGGSAGESFELKAPPGFYFRSLRGGIGELVHNIELEPFPWY